MEDVKKTRISNSNEQLANKRVCTPKSSNSSPVQVPWTPDLNVPAYIKFADKADSVVSCNEAMHDQSVPFSASNYGLLKVLEDLYRKRGLTKLYGWQHECLQDSDVVEKGMSFVYSAPTGGGKSLVAEMLLLRKLCLCKDKINAIQLLVLPFISIVNEKAQEMETSAASLTFGVQRYYGSQGMIPPLPGPNLCVCTMEKANNIINSLLEEDRLDELGIVAVDEIHLISDAERGNILETMLVKLLCAWPPLCNRRVQIIGMSATIPNQKDIANWLTAKLYKSEKRPTTLHEYLRIEGREGTMLKEFVIDSNISEPPWKKSARITQTEDFHFYTSSSSSASTLIFCPTRQGTPTFAVQLAYFLSAICNNDQDEEVQAKRQSLADELQDSQHGDNVLHKIVLQAGVAYHHGGLTLSEREVIEKGFKSRVIKILCATSTLAIGINLPARRVILKGVMVGREKMKASQYHQMIGRAGRPGLDPYGECYLVVKEKDWLSAKNLMTEPLPDCKSSLIEDDGSFIRLSLELVCCRLATTEKLLLTPFAEHVTRGGHGFFQTQELQDCLQHSYLAVHIPNVDIKARVLKAVQYLLTKDFLTESQDGLLVPCPLGNATFKSSFGVEAALIVRDQLGAAQKSLVISNDLHMVYLTTPVSGLPEPDWIQFIQLFLKLKDEHLQVAKAVGVTGRFLQLKGMGSLPSNGSSGKDQFNAKRFWAALLLHDAILEVPFADLTSKYNVTCGSIQALMSNASYFAFSMVGFCKAMGWWALELIIANYISRLGAGVKSDLVELVEVPLVRAKRARALHIAGIRTVEALARMKPEQLICSVRSALGPYPMRTAVDIIRHAKKVLQTKVEELKNTARCLSEVDGS